MLAFFLTKSSTCDKGGNYINMNKQIGAMLALVALGFTPILHTSSWNLPSIKKEEEEGNKHNNINNDKHILSSLYWTVHFSLFRPGLKQ